MYRIIGKDGDKKDFDALVILTDTPEIFDEVSENIKHIQKCFIVSVASKKLISFKELAKERIQSFYAHSLMTPCLEDCPDYLKNLIEEKA